MKHGQSRRLLELAALVGLFGVPTIVAAILVTLVVIHSGDGGSDNGSGGDTTGGRECTDCPYPTPVIPVDRRAVELGIAPVTRDGQRVVPGDRVNIRGGYRDNADSTILENVEVIATRDQPSPKGTPGNDGSLVVLAVGPEQAQVLVSAQERATPLWLALTPLIPPTPY